MITISPLLGGGNQHLSLHHVSVSQTPKGEPPPRLEQTLSWPVDIFLNKKLSLIVNVSAIIYQQVTKIKKNKHRQVSADKTF